MIYMRDKRAIILKNPRLQRIRNGLRDIILEAKYVKTMHILNQMKELKKARSIDDLSQREFKQYRTLQKQESKLSNIARRSICMCVVCGKGNRDMVYNKPYDAWYCTECYGMERSSAQKSGKARQRSPKSCEEEAVESHSKTFL
ncbi:hypothetical protein LCGC14_1740440 [marine sediment metagenome]|uniref:Uncharacterized protein n=1 Tax=marine sediment metagenome TaxID=412755 RepID=A0A0F9K6K7_9ZZZZ